MPFRIATNTIFPIVIPDVSTVSAGIMSAADKIKLDGLSPGSLAGIIDVTPFPGADLGAKINSADAFLGATPGILYVPSAASYTISTPVVLSPNRILYLGVGHYFNLTPVNFATFLLDDNCAVIGSGWGTIIDEPDAPSFVIFDTVADFADGTGSNTNLHYSNMQLLGKGSIVGLTAQSTLVLGNAKNVTIDKIYFNGTAAIAIEAGGSSATGNYADTVEITGCVFDQIPSENIGIVNAQNVRIENNAWKNRTNSAGGIDCEPNAATDRLVNVVISGNSMKGFGVLVQGGGGALLQGIEIVGNVISGVFFNGARNVLLSDNNFAASGGTNAVSVVNADGCEISNNRFDNAGQAPGGGAAIACTDMTNCLVMDNYFYNPHVTAGFPGWAAIIEIPGGGCDYNRYIDNVLEQPVDAPGADNFPVISIDGAHSRVWNNSYAGRFRMGGVEYIRRVIAANDSVVQSDQILGVDTSTLAITLTLPNPAVVGATNTNGPLPGGVPGPTSGSQMFTVQDESGAASTHNITIKRFGTEKINGVAADYVVNTDYKRVVLYTNGTDWFLA